MSLVQNSQLLRTLYRVEVTYGTSGYRETQPATKTLYSLLLHDIH